MQFGLARQLVQHGERFAISRVLAAQFFDALLHRRIEVVPPSLVGQGEVSHEFESCPVDEGQDINHPPHGRIVRIEARLHLGWRVLLAPYGFREGEVAAGTKQFATDMEGVLDADPAAAISSSQTALGNSPIGWRS